MSLYLMPIPPSPTPPPAPTVAPQPAIPCDSYTEEGCFIDDRNSRILERVLSSSTMSAEVRVQLVDVKCVSCIVIPLSD